MPENNSYITITSFIEYTYKEKGSEFIARAFPADTEEEAIKLLNDIKKSDYDATHHCYALRLKNGFVKYSDDGEPSGTAGIRILNAIDHFSLQSVLLVVTRYYGGTKLGIGPLGKAYYAAAEGVLEKCEKITKRAYLEINILIDFALISQVHRALSLYEAKITGTDYLEKVSFTCLVHPSDIKELIKHLTDLSKGSAEVKNTGKTLFL